MMRLSCLAGRHEAGPRRVPNQGLEFGRCWICGRDLVRSSGNWRTVPRGFRVVWRRHPPVPAGAASAAQLLLDLSASGRALAFPRRPERRRSRVAAAAELVALAARGLAWAVAYRVGAWLKALSAPRVAPQRVFRLRAA